MTDADRKQIQSHDEINAAFADWSVVSASKKKLQQWLVTLCTVKMESPANTERNKMRVAAIQHLLAARLSAEAHRKSFWLSMAAFIVSFTSLVLSILFASP